ncbi:MAG: helix-turn-helix domain-containing protein [Myxococcales bacterium]|nr:helix-turn-helix domain-containing protein [Myxococcales bacterium]
MLNRCPNCNSKNLATRPIATSRSVAGHLFTAAVPGQTCCDCGEKVYAAADLARFDLATALALADAGETSGEAVRSMRKAAGVSAKKLAELLDVRPESVSRWENDRGKVDRATLAVLRQIIAERAGIPARNLVTFLRSLAKPKKLALRVALDMRKLDGELSGGR